MDFGLLIKGLKEEAKRNVQFARMKKFPRFLARVLTLPALIGVMFAFACYYLTLFVYKACLTPVTYLHNILKGEKNNNQGVQVVVYLIGFPVVLQLYVYLAFATVSFYFQWFVIMVLMEFATLNGVKFQPIITEANYDYERVWELKPTEKKANNWALSVILRFPLAIILYFITMFFAASGEVDLGGIEIAIGVIFGIAATLCIVSAIFSWLFAPIYKFRKTEIVDFEEVEFTE